MVFVDARAAVMLIQTDGSDRPPSTVVDLTAEQVGTLPALPAWT
jgi:hypothetical protein